MTDLAAVLAIGLKGSPRGGSCTAARRCSASSSRRCRSRLPPRAARQSTGYALRSFEVEQLLLVVLPAIVVAASITSDLDDRSISFICGRGRSAGGRCSPASSSCCRRTSPRSSRSVGSPRPASARARSPRCRAVGALDVPGALVSTLVAAGLTDRGAALRHVAHDHLHARRWCDRANSGGYSSAEHHRTTSPTWRV